MKKIIGLVCLVCCVFFNSFAKENNEKFNLLGSGEVFNLNPVTDSILLGSGIALSGTMLVLNDILKVNQHEYSGSLPDKSSIWAIDRAFMKEYNKFWDYSAWGTMSLNLAYPLVLFGVGLDKEEWFTVGTMYAETLLLANGTKELLKCVVDRARPYMYYSGAPQSKLEDGDWDDSFVSGHTTIAFSAAAFTSYVFCQYFPESKYKWAVIASNFGIAAFVGASRMISGNHYFTDVVSGALIGSAIGFVVPALHQITPKHKNARGNGFEVSPAGVSFTFRNF